MYIYNITQSCPSPIFTVSLNLDRFSYALLLLPLAFACRSLTARRTALRAVNGRRFAPPPPPAPSCRRSPDTFSLSPLLGFMCHVHARRMVPRPGLANKFAAHFLWHVPICSASLLCKLHATVGAGPAAARKATVLTSKVARQRSSWFATQPPWSGKA